MSDKAPSHPKEQNPNIKGENPSFPSTNGSKLEGHDRVPSHLRQGSSRLRKLFYIFWLLTESNALTFVGPNTIFGLCGALSGSWMVETRSDGNGDKMSVLKALGHLGLVILFNWSNLFIFDLANQRLPESAAEDALALNHFALGVGVESLAIITLTWLYNDLRGGDENYVTRNFIIAAAFGIYNTASVKVAVGIDTMRGEGPFAGLSSKGVMWTAMVSVAIFTTMQVQDLQDVKGDRARGRRSAPIVMGDWLARWSVAAPMLLWPTAGAWFWDAGIALGSPQIVLGTLVAVRCLWYSGLQADKLTWRLWCLWTAMLYTLPPLCYHMKN